MNVCLLETRESPSDSLSALLGQFGNVGALAFMNAVTPFDEQQPISVLGTAPDSSSAGTSSTLAQQQIPLNNSPLPWVDLSAPSSVSAPTQTVVVQADDTSAQSGADQFFVFATNGGASGFAAIPINSSLSSANGGFSGSMGGPSSAGPNSAADASNTGLIGGDSSGGDVGLGGSTSNSSSMNSGIANLTPASVDFNPPTVNPGAPSVSGNAAPPAIAPITDAATVQSAEGNATVTLSSIGGTLANVHAEAAPADSASRLPLGMFGFEVHNVTPGGSATVQMTFPRNFVPNGYWKQDPATGALERFNYDGTTGATVAGNVLKLHLVDGGPGDADGKANGIIVDPGGPGGPVATDIIAVGPDAGRQPLVKVYDAVTHAEKYDFMAFNSQFMGGVRVAAGDVNGDGHSDIVVGAGPGGGSQVRVFDGVTGSPLAGTLGSFNAFDAGVTNGVNVAVGDVNGDGKADIIVGTDVGSTSPLIRVFSGATGALMFSVLGNDANFTGGERVAAADVNGDGFADVIAAAGPGGPPRVQCPPSRNACRNLLVIE
jgi:hypothetical protein